jgi:hypothetical protein
LSDYLENKLIDHLFRATAYTAPSALYYGLFTAAPSDSGGGTEVTGGSYARAQLDPSTTNYRNTQNSGTGASSGTGGQTANASVITYPTPTANWGTITHIGVFDAATSGNLLAHGALSQSKNVNNGDPAPTFPAGSFTFTLA